MVSLVSPLTIGKCMLSVSSGDSSTASHMRLSGMWSQWRRLVQPFSSLIWKDTGAHALPCLKFFMNTFSTSVKVTSDCMIMVPQLLPLLLFYPLVNCRSQSGTEVPTQEHLSKGYSGCSANALLGKDTSESKWWNSSAANWVPYCLIYTVDLGMPNLANSSGGGAVLWVQKWQWSLEWHQSTCMEWTSIIYDEDHLPAIGPVKSTCSQAHGLDWTFG